MRTKKARESRGHKNVPEYVSHMEAYAKLNQYDKSEAEKEHTRLNYAKLIA